MKAERFSAQVPESVRGLYERELRAYTFGLIYLLHDLGLNVNINNISHTDAYRFIDRVTTWRT